MKRTLAMLLCLAMLLSFVPATIFSVSAETDATDDTIIELPIVPRDEVETEPAPDAGETPEAPAHAVYCKACGQVVTWTAVANGDIIGGKGHYYLTEDCTYTDLLPIISVAAGDIACVDLNGFDLNTTAELNVKGTLNIQGEGNVGGAIGYVGNKDDVNFDDLIDPDPAATFDAALFNIAAGAVVNIYDGTYAVTNDKPIVVANGALNVLGGEIAGTVNAADLTLGGAAMITKIETANLTVKADWTGAAVITAAVLETGAAEDDFTGSLKTTEGKIVFHLDGKLATELPVKMTGITVTAPAKEEYELGDELALDGMVVTGVYSNETTAPIAEGFTVTGFDSETAGVKTITVTYGGFTATFEVTVKEAAAVIEDIEVTTLPSKLTYMVGASFDAKGMVISAVYSDGSKVEITDYTVDVDLATAGTKTVTITSGEFTAAFTVEVLTSVEITVNAENAAKGITVSWTDAGADTYKVYYRSLSEGTWGSWTLATSTTKTSYNHTAAVAGTTYEYKVIALVSEIEIGQAVSAQVTAVKAPTVTVENVTAGIQITWPDAAGAEAYYVYRADRVDGAAGEYTKISETSNLSYVDKTAESGKRYYYMVRVLSNGALSAAGTGVELRRLADVTNVTTENSPSVLKLKWKGVEGAAKYRIYYSEYTSGEWSSWKSTYVDAPTTTYKLTGVNGRLYRFKVRALNGTTYSSAVPDEKSVEYMRLTLVGMSAQNEATGIKVTWSKNSAAEVYELYRSSQNPTTLEWTSWGKPILTTTDREFMDTTAENGVTYRYTVRVRNGAYISGFKDGAVLCRLDRVNILSLANNTSEIRVTWAKNDKAGKYMVYRDALLPGTTDWTGWKKQGYVNSTEYKDTDVVDGAIYRYRVTAVEYIYESAGRVSDNITRIGITTCSATKTSSGIRITWSANAMAQSYTLQRRTKTADGYTAWEDISTTATSPYMDTTAEVGQTYQYRVRAVNGNSMGYGKATADIKR